MRWVLRYFLALSWGRQKLRKRQARLVVIAGQLAILPIALPLYAGSTNAVRIGPVDASKIDVALTLASNAVKHCAGQFRGQVMFYDVTAATTVSGNLRAAAGACEFSTLVPWRSISEKMVQQARGDVLQVRFFGELIDGKLINKVNWVVAATRANLVLTEPMKETVKRFAKATDLRMGDISLRDSTVNAGITVQSPLGFDLRVNKIACALEIHGVVVATGTKESFVLFSGRPTPLLIPVSIQHKALLSASGSVFSKMGKVNGRLFGTVQLRLTSGNMELPMEFPVQLNLI